LCHTAKVDHLLPASRLEVVVEDDQAVGVGLAPDHCDLAAPLVLDVDDRPGFRSLAARAPDESELRPESFSRFALGLVVLCLRLLESAPHAQQVIAKPVVGGQQLGLLLGRADQLLEGVLERSLHALLPVGHVSRPGLVLR
jgi:hypothetical protein